MKIKLYFFIMFMMLITWEIKVEASEYIRFNNLVIEDGLSQGTVEEVFQDSRGYLWFGSNNGLNRYNGYEFVIYRNELDNEKSLVSDYIFDLKEDEQGSIWVATMKGVSKIDKDDIITNYQIKDEKGVNVSSILITKNKDILIGTGNGIYIYDRKNDKFKDYVESSKLSSTDINDIAEDEEGNIWVATNNGLNKINLSSEEVQQYLEFNDNHLYTVYCEKDDVWLGGYESGAYKFNQVTGETSHYVHDEMNENSLAGNIVRNIMRDSSGNLWFATSGGISRLDENSNEFINYTKKIYDSNSLVNNQVYSLLEDSAGTLWAGTYAGVSNFNPYSNILHYKSDPFDDTTLSDDMVKGLYEDDEGCIWVGTNSSGVDIFNSNLEKVYNIKKSSENNTLSSNIINGINGYKNYIFISTYEGLDIIDQMNGEIHHINKVNGLSSNNIQQTLVDSKGNLWVATNSGVDILDWQGNVRGNLTEIFKKFNVDNTYTRVLFEDSKKNIWVGNFVNGGLFRVNISNGEVKNYTVSNSDLSSNTIRAIAEDQNGVIWIGTSTGLNKYYYETEEFESYTSYDGLANNTVYGVIIDDENNPWVSTNLGVSKYDLQDDIFINYTVLDGLQSNEFNGLSYLKLRNGKFIFGGVNGFNLFSTAGLLGDKEKPKLIIDKIKVNGVEVDSIQGKELDYNEKNITLKFFVNNFKNVAAYKFYYKLLGKDDQWQPLDSNAVAFSNLSPGDYTYKFKVRNSSGVFSEEVEIRLTIKEVWWKSKVFICIVLLILIVLLINYRAKVKILNAIVDQKTKKLKNEMLKSNELLNKNIEIERKKNSYFVNLSHELRTPLNVIYSTEQLILELNKSGIKKEKLNHYVDIMMGNTKRLLKLINNIIDASKIENGNYKIYLKDTDIIELVENITFSMKDYIESKGIELIIDPEVEEKIIRCDENAIERCMINLLENAYKFTEPGGVIRVNIYDEDSLVRIEVIDTGKGINEKDYEGIFERFIQAEEEDGNKKGSGLGLSITKQIIEYHHGKIYVESKIGEGSKFIIILPT